MSKKKRCEKCGKKLTPRHFWFCSGTPEKDSPVRTGVNLDALGLAAVPNSIGGLKLVAKPKQDFKDLPDVVLTGRELIHKVPKPQENRR